MSSRHVVYKHIQEMSQDELEQYYDISINKDRVYDNTERREFEDLTEWANFIADLDEDENYGSFERIGHKGKYDDEF